MIIFDVRVLILQLKGKKIIFLGDSITEGVGVSSIDKRYADVFANITEVESYVNYGISATRIARQQKIQDEYVDTRAFTERFEHMDEDADIVVVFGGTNDYGHGDAPFGMLGDRTNESYCGAVHVLMKGLIKKYPMSTIVFMTPLHRECEYVPNPTTGRELKAYVDVIRTVAEYYSIPVLDLYATAGICPDIKEQKELLCPDGLHPNDAGSRIIAERLKYFLESL